MQKLLGERIGRTSRPYYNGPRIQLDMAALCSRHFINPNMTNDWQRSLGSGGQSTFETIAARGKRLNTLKSDAINSSLPLERSLEAVSKLKEENALTELKEIAENKKTPAYVGLEAVMALDHLEAWVQLEKLSMNRHAPEHVVQSAAYLVKTRCSHEGDP